MEVEAEWRQSSRYVAINWMKIFIHEYKGLTLHLTDLQHSALFYKWVPYIPHKLIFLVILLSQLKTVHIIEIGALWF